MSQTSSLPDYAAINAVFFAEKADLNVSQVHGLICGFIAATGGELNERLENLFGKNHPPQVSQILKQVIEASYHEMTDFSFEFALLLPDDETDINIRTENLGLWCQGFLTGLEQCNISIQHHEENDLGEALNDLIEISQVSYGDITLTEEDETSYFELVEYVRLSALLIFQELQKPHNPSDQNTTEPLH